MSLRQIEMDQRPRRNRASNGIRNLVRETQLTTNDLVWPVFIQEGKGLASPIASMPGCFRYSLDLLLNEVERAVQNGIQALALFPVIDDKLKDPMASESTNSEGLLPRTVRALKEKYPELILMTDVAMDPYSSDGHDGIVKDGEIVNDETLEVLAQMALTQARAGADIVAPSDMMDGRVGYIRQALDGEGFHNVGILSYCVKYASAFYGPFRDALDSAPKFGDKKTYQMDPANKKEALREIDLDEQEGADVLMVKPAMAYLDVIDYVKSASRLPVAAYQVSGEYAMIMAASQNGWLDEKSAALESLLAIKRSGADMIFTYFAPKVAEWLRNS